jgi:hypothetical protein
MLVDTCEYIIKTYPIGRDKTVEVLDLEPQPFVNHIWNNEPIYDELTKALMVREYL